MQAQTFVVNFHKYAANEKTLLDRYCSTFDKGTQSIKVTLPIKITPFHYIYIFLSKWMHISTNNITIMIKQKIKNITKYKQHK